MKALLALLLCLFACGPAAAQVFSFGVFGDTPYRPWEREHLPDMMKEMDKEDLSFVVHVGDIKSGGARCADTVYLDIYGLFQTSGHPLVYVPGDNEWTDCGRVSNGSYDPRERLARLRAIFFADDYSLGKEKMALERQTRNRYNGAYRENVRWRVGPVLFVGLNVTGSQNNIGNKDKPGEEFINRNAANLAWLEKSFQIAREARLAGIAIFIQANPELEFASQGDHNPAFADFQKQLIRETLNFPGQVLLAHGDTHNHRIDRPLSNPATNQLIRNFRRVEVYGSPFLGWVKVTVDPATPALFRFESRPYTEMP